MIILIDGRPKMEIDNVDIQIGAVEIKNATTDDRCLVSDASTARAITDHVLEVQHLDATGKVQPAGEIVSNPIFTTIGDGTTAVIVETAGTKKALNVNITDGTYDHPTMDVVGRRGFVGLTDGTNDGAIDPANTARTTATVVQATQHVDATGKVQPAGDLVGNGIFTRMSDGTTVPVVETTGTKKALNVNITDGTNDMPTGDALARGLFVNIGDGTTTAVVETAGTKKALNVNITDGTNDMPTGDAVARSIYTAIGDGAQTIDVETLEADIDGKNAITTNSLNYGMETSGTTHPLLCTAAGALRVDIENDAEVATTPVIYNVEMTNLDTQYSQALPANTKILEFNCREEGFDVRYSFETGKVATPTAPYKTLKAGAIKTVDGLNLTSKTLYFACGTAAKNIEIECWS